MYGTGMTNQNFKEPMILRRRKKYGQSTIEFVAILLFILGVFFVFQKYIVRGFSGRWKSIGDSLGDGRIYDPSKTTECVAGPGAAPVIWYNKECCDAIGVCNASCRTTLCDD